MARFLRRAFENGLDKVPSGPLGIVGGGNVVGAVSMTTAEIAGTVVPGSEFDPGFRIKSHNVRRQRGEERHTLEVDSFIKPTARFVSKWRAAPSGLDFFIQDVEVESVEKVRERGTSTTWKVEAVIDRRS